MKNYSKIALALILVFTLVLVGCGGGNTPSETTTQAAADQTTQAADSTTDSAMTNSGDAKLGLAIIANSKDSADAGDEAGVAKTSAMIAAVLIDKDGKVVKASIDAVSVDVNFDKSGKLLTPTDQAFASKRELGDTYGMKKASEIGKEWYEQVDFFENYIVGKTLDEIKGIAIAEDGKAGAEDLKAGITVHIGGFIAVVEKAINNAKAGSSADDMLGLAVKTSIGRSKDVADEDGVAETSISVAASTFDKDGKINNAIIDAVQNNITFDKDGKITSDLTAPIKSKVELGDSYGMKKASEIGKEWYEQAEAFAQYVVGKDIAEVNGIALNEGKPADEDLKASVTLHIADFQKTLEKAFANKKQSYSTLFY